MFFFLIEFAFSPLFFIYSIQSYVILFIFKEFIKQRPCYTITHTNNTNAHCAHHGAAADHLHHVHVLVCDIFYRGK